MTPEEVDQRIAIIKGNYYGRAITDSLLCSLVCDFMSLAKELEASGNLLHKIDYFEAKNASNLTLEERAYYGMGLDSSRYYKIGDPSYVCIIPRSSEGKIVEFSYKPYDQYRFGGTWQITF